jgi:hypothetical protein
MQPSRRRVDRWTRSREDGASTEPTAGPRFSRRECVHWLSLRWSNTRSLVDHMVRPQQDRLRDREPQGLRRLEVDDQLKLGGLFHGKVGGLRAFENLVDVGRGPPIIFRKDRPTSPELTGSETNVNTIGTVLVTALAASAVTVLSTTRTSALSLISSAARSVPIRRALHISVLNDDVLAFGVAKLT